MRTKWARCGVGWLALTSACIGPPAPSALAVVSAPAAAPGPLPPTKSDGTPYVWKNVTILGGGFVTGIVFSHAQAGLIYARTDVGGAYRWDSNARSWLPLTDMFGRVDSNYTGIESIAADPLEANKVYAAAGTYVQPWAPNGALLRSSDKGATWARTDLPFRVGGNEYGRSIGERLAVDPNKTDVLFLGSRKSGLWRSSDAAVTWTQVAGFPVKEDASGFGVGFVLFDAKSGAKGAPTPTLYAGLAGAGVGLYVSNDAGVSWRSVPGQPQRLTPHHAALDSKGVLYLSYADGPGPAELTSGAVYAYQPSSGIWNDISPLAPSAKDKFGYGGLAVDANRPGTLIVTTMDRWTLGDELFRSSDGGKHWSALLGKAVRDVAGANYLYFGHDRLGPPGWMGDVDIDPFNSNHVLHVSGQGVWASEDATRADRNQPTHWAFDNQGLEATVASRIVSPPSGAALLSGVSDICGFRHDDLSRPSPSGMFKRPICSVASGIDYAALAPERVVRVGNIWGAGKHGAWSRDGGATWAPFPSEPKGSETGGLIAISADGQTLFWAMKRGVPAYSRDNGASWREASGLPFPEESAAGVPSHLRVASDRVNSRKFYVFDSAAGKVYASEDGAAHFVVTTRGLPKLAEWARTSGSIEAMPGVEGELWLSTSKDVYRSSNSGRSFEPLGNVEESYGLGFGRAAPDRANLSVFLTGRVAGVSGFFRSDDLGMTWVRINDDQHQFGFVSVISGDLKRFGRAYIGTGGRGILYGDPR
jgi:xyloglucan-specific exo-beta-1,4-glucanase